MKIKCIYKLGVVSAIAFATLCSCNDFLTIYPTDRIVGNEFWKTKSHVDEMVDGTYKSMLDYGIQERAIIWGAFRSDELLKHSSLSDNTLENIEGVNLLPTYSYCSWAAFYKVINNCNVVLNHAPDVLKEDPAFTEGDYQVVRAQMLALRSLCYFYLVRAFRDVPYTTHSYEEDTQVEMLPQSAPDVVLQQCLDDLVEAEKYVVKSGAYSDWRDKGYMTRDAVDALIADIYLWRASMTHNKTDYQQAITYIDKVINAKDQYYRDNYQLSVTGDVNDIYHLAEGKDAYKSIFAFMNSHESILEWQYNGTNNANDALMNILYDVGNNDNPKNYGRLQASALFSPAKTDGSKIYLTKDDYRFWDNVYGVSEEDNDDPLNIRKMIGTAGAELSSVANSHSRSLKEFQQNWIAYRLTDLMLMKAEALVETAADSTDEAGLKNAFELVKIVYNRSLLKGSKDSLNFDSYKTMDKMEQLVLEERERELCFEGKRWFDLMRYCYRHMNGVNINQRLADATEWPVLYKPMLALVARKYLNGSGDVVSFKMKCEPYLYWPVQLRELKVNSLLKQNPAYNVEEMYSKN